MSGIWIIAEDQTAYCNCVRVRNKELYAYNTNESEGDSCVALPFEERKKALAIKSEIDDAIMRGDTFYRLDI